MSAFRLGKGISFRLAPAALLWTAGIVGIYAMTAVPRLKWEINRTFNGIFLAHGEFAASIAAALWHGAIAFFAAGLACLAAMATGELALNLVFGRRSNAADRVLWNATFGLGICGIAIAGLGFGGLIRPLLIIPALVAAAAAGIPLFARHFRFSSYRPIPSFAVMILLAALAGIFTSALAPEIEVDSLHYHLGKAQLYIRTGRLISMPFNLHFHFPSLWELILLPPLMVGGESAGKLMNPLVVLFTGLLLRLALAQSGPAKGWIAATLFMSAGWVTTLACSLKNDLIVALFSFAGLLAIMRSNGLQGRRWAFVGGSLLGFAIGVKYTALLTVGIAIPALLFRRTRRNVPVHILGLIAVGAALLAFLPWLVKGFFETANPFYPIATSFLDGGPGRQLSDWSRWMMKSESYGWLFGSYSSIGDKLRAAWTLVATEVPVNSLLPALSLPALAVLIMSRLPGSAWAGLSLASFALWTFGPPQPRFLIQSYPLIAGTIEFGLGAWSGSSITRKWLLRFLICGAALQTVFIWVFISVADRPARMLTAAGLVSRDVYLRHRLTSYADAILWANHHLPKESRVLIYGELRSVPLDRPVIIPSYAEPAPFLTLAEESSGPAHFGRKLRQLGITHLLYNKLCAVTYRARLAKNLPSDRCLKLWADYWRTHSILRYQSQKIDSLEGAYYIFALNEGASESASLLLPGVEGWLYYPEMLLAGGDLAGAMELFAYIEKLTGNVAIIRQAYATLFRKYLPPARIKEILNDVDLRGLKSVMLYLELARLARNEGNHALAGNYFRRAQLLSPLDVDNIAINADP